MVDADTRAAAWWRCKALYFLRGAQLEDHRAEALRELAALGLDEALAKQVVTWPLEKVIRSKLWQREVRIK